MRKAKIMLIAITILASVGAALAFKVNVSGGSDYCYTVMGFEPMPGECILSAQNVEINPFGSGAKIYYTTTWDAVECPYYPVSCPNEARLPFLD